MNYIHQSMHYFCIDFKRPSIFKTTFLSISVVKKQGILYNAVCSVHFGTQLNIRTEQRSMGSPLSLGLAKCLNLFGFKYSEWWNVSPSETTSAFFQVQFRQLCKGFMQVWMNSNTGVKDKSKWNKCSTYDHFSMFGRLICVCWFQDPFMQHLSYESSKSTTLF